MKGISEKGGTRYLATALPDSGAAKPRNGRLLPAIRALDSNGAHTRCSGHTPAEVR